MITRRSFLKWAGALVATVALTDPVVELLEGLAEEESIDWKPMVGVDLASGPDWTSLVAGEDIRMGDLVITEKHGQGAAYRMRSLAHPENAQMMAVGGAVTSAREGRVVIVVARFANSFDPLPGQITFDIPWDREDPDLIGDLRRAARS